MIKIFFEPILLESEQARLVNFLTKEEWPFHVNSRLSPEKVQVMIADGIFGGSNHKCFWIRDEDRNEIDLIRLFDLDDIDDGYPMFDLRIQSSQRGHGVGKKAVLWLTKYLFEEHSKLDRIAGTTRADNVAMRKIFKSCGYVKEGHFRKDWPSNNDQCFDTVRYGILREDWLSGCATSVPWDDEP